MVGVGTGTIIIRAIIGVGLVVAIKVVRVTFARVIFVLWV